VNHRPPARARRCVAGRCSADGGDAGEVQPELALAEQLGEGAGGGDAPRSRMTTRSHTRSTSPMRWEFSSTATPRAFSDRTMSRTSTRPSGSSALVGSSSTTSSGGRRARPASPRRCCIPLEKPPTRSAVRAPRPTSSRHAGCSCASICSPTASRAGASTSAALSHGW
jgi:hypothetical protein